MAKAKGVRRGRASSTAGLSTDWVRNYVIAGIKKVWSAYATERKAALNAVRSESLYIKVDGSQGNKVLVHYECAHCKENHPSKNVQVDHVTPIGKQPPWPPNGDGSWDRYISRVFCTQENLQVLCKPCHKTKSKQERQQGAYE